MNRKPFTPQPGVSYRNHDGGVYECVETFDAENGGAVMRIQESGFTLNAYKIGIYDDGSIDWESSDGGHIARGKVIGQHQTGKCEYCGTPGKTVHVIEQKFDTEHHGSKVFISVSGGYLQIFSDCVPIAYCPVCGRKLRKSEGMQDE